MWSARPPHAHPVILTPRGVHPTAVVLTSCSSLWAKSASGFQCASYLGESGGGGRTQHIYCTAM